MLSDAGIDFPRALPVRKAEDLDEAARDLRAPLVLKAGWLDHKTEVGGLRIGLHGPGELRRAFEEMAGRLGEGGPYVLEELDDREHVVEMLVGGRQDASFGPVVVVGAGGTEVALHDDATVDLAPVDHATALAMIDRLRSRNLLGRWRGRPAVDVDALARTVVIVSRLIAENPAIREMELNPVRVSPTGATAVDALIVGSEARAGDAVT